MTKISSSESAPSPPFRSTSQIQSSLWTTTGQAAHHNGEKGVRRVKDDIQAFLESELDVSRLNTVHEYLWVAGRPMAARALHKQRMLERQIMITEQADLHLLWTHTSILIKPLQTFLLDYQFWLDHICPDQALHASACGFILSYAWLVCHQSDFKIAMECGLLPSQLQWAQWTEFIDDFLSNVDHVDHETFGQVNKRYRYGELRLGKLNHIYRFYPAFRGRFILRGYLYRYDSYRVFFRRNFAWILVAFVYITIILQGLQVGLDTDELGQDQRFQKAAYIFTVFSITTGAVVAALVAFLFLFFLSYNLSFTHSFLKQRRQYRSRLKHEKGASTG